jgi:hypothetical protein
LNENKFTSLPFTIGTLKNLTEISLLENDQLILEDRPGHPMYLDSVLNQLVFYWRWSPSTHSYFPRHLRNWVRTVFIGFLVNETCNIRVPKEILLHILSFIYVDNAIRLAKLEEVD